MIRRTMPATVSALLMTDVVDSTHLSQVLGDARMAAVWLAHDSAARDLLKRWRGREIEKTDGLLALFDSATDAVHYALDYHRALAGLAQPLSARAAVHIGQVTVRETDSEYFEVGAKRFEVDGLVKPVVARVMSLALGGQTLLTQDAFGALGASEQAVKSHGHWRLKGLAEPIELIEIGHENAPFIPPPDEAKAYRVVRHHDLWLPLREVRHSLSAERDTFVGREDALRLLATKLEGSIRLVSVLGMGGTGKTRLATRFAWIWLGDYPGGSWFCDLSQARTLDGIYFAVATGLELPLGPSDSMAQLTQAIAGRGRCLVILDNFEQVAKHAEEVLGPWLDRAPQAQFIVTTREVLGVAGEDTLTLSPMSRSEAVELFRQRAASVGRAQPAGADQATTIDGLVDVLDRLPLAIELAAARTRVMSVKALLARIHERFDLLRSRSGRRERQSTLRATFDWSWELLDDGERAALAQMSVFEGGFTLASSDEILDAAARHGAGSSLDVVQSLVEKSFVRQLDDDRYDLLRSVREYAAEHLRVEGRYSGSGVHAAGAACRRHWTHFASLGEAHAPLNRCVEADNLVSACRRATEAADIESAIGCLIGAWAALRLTGPFRVGFELAKRLLVAVSMRPADRAFVHWVAGCACEMTGQIEEACQHFHDGLATADGALPAKARLLLGLGARQTLDGHGEDAQRNLDEAHRLARLLGDQPLEASVLNSLGRLMDHQSRIAQARSYYQAALELATLTGNLRLQGGLIGNLGGLHHDLGQLEQAQSHYRQALSLARLAGDRPWEGNAHCNLGMLYLEQGRSGDALAQFDLALTIARETGNARLEYVLLCNRGQALEAEGDFTTACNQIERAVHAAHAAFDLRSEGQFRGPLAINLARSGKLDAARECLERGEVLLLEVGDRLSYAMLLCDRADIEGIAMAPNAALRAIERAEALAQDLSAGPDSGLRRRLLRLREELTPTRS